MTFRYDNLSDMLEKNLGAKKYFDSLPDYVREHIQTRSDKVNTMACLRAYGENLLRGDG